MDTAARYRTFAAAEVHGRCDLYDVVCRRIADDGLLCALIDRLPPERRQPNLVLAAARYVGIPTTDPDAFLAGMHHRWPHVEDVARRRHTQTNEPARLATLLPVLAGLPQPLALIEVGASAGLCLYPDRYGYRYDDGPRIDPSDGPSDVLLDCVTTGGVPIPTGVPTISHRRGIDLNPIDITDVNDVRWLEALVWPGQEDRLDRLRSAITIARRDPVIVDPGDLVELIGPAVHDATDSAETVVVFHSAVLTYVPVERRTAFVRAVGELPCRWIANEGFGVLPRPTLPPDRSTTARFVLTLDGVPLARTDPHGRSIDWLPDVYADGVHTDGNV